MPEKTIRQAAEELHSVVTALHELIEREYPSRREVERRFMSKAHSDRRWAIAFLTIIASAILSFIGTVSTVSTCFLGDMEDRPGICNAIPGYETTINDNIDHLKEYYKLRERLARLERRSK